jgi:hypothetical protein
MARREVARISVGLGLLCMVFGGVVFCAGGEKDLGGIVGGEAKSSPPAAERSVCVPQR